MEQLTGAECQQVRTILQGRGLIMNTRLVLLGVDKENPTGTSVLVAGGPGLHIVDNAIGVFPPPDPDDPPDGDSLPLTERQIGFRVDPRTLSDN